MALYVVTCLRGPSNNPEVESGSEQVFLRQAPAKTTSGPTDFSLGLEQNDEPP